MTEQQEDDFMDFEKVDDKGYAKELNELIERANSSDMTEEEYEEEKQKLVEKYS